MTDWPLFAILMLFAAFSYGIGWRHGASYERIKRGEEA